MTRDNPYENRARQRKVDALTSTALRLYTGRDMGTLIVAMLIGTHQQWAKLAKMASVNMPSLVSRRMVINNLRAWCADTHRQEHGPAPR